MPPSTVPGSQVELARSMAQAPAVRTLGWERAEKLNQRYQEIKNTEHPTDALRPETRGAFTIDTAAEISRRIKDPTRLGQADAAVRRSEAARRGQLTVPPLAPAQRAALVENLTREAVMSRPAFRALLDPTTGAMTSEALSVIDQVIDSTRYQEKVQKLMEASLNPDEDIVTALAAVVKEELDAKTALDIKVATFPSARGITEAQLQAEIDEFAESPWNTAGTKGDWIKALATNEATDRQLIKDITDEANDLVTAGRLTRAQWDAQLADVRHKVRTGVALSASEQNLKDFMDAQNRMRELDGLKVEKANCEEVLKLTKDHAAAKEKLDTAKARQEDAVVKKLDSIIKDAADIILDEEINARLEVLNTQLAEDTTNAKSEDEKHLFESLKLQLEKPVYKNGVEVDSKIDKDMTRMYFGEMMAKGPEHAIRELLVVDITRRIDPTAVPPARYRPGTPGYIAEVVRINKQLSNREFMDAVRGKVVKHVASRHFLTGGKITKNQIRLLRETDWGQALVSDAMEENRELMRQISAAGDNLAGFWNKVKRASSGNFLLFLVMLLAIPTVMKLGGVVNPNKF